MAEEETTLEETKEEPKEEKPGFPCPECDFVAKNKFGLISHMKKHKEKVEKPQPAAIPKPRGEPKKYVCIEKCPHNRKLYRRGDYAWFTDDYPKDEHGNILYFELVDPDKPQPTPEEPVVTVTGTT